MAATTIHLLLKKSEYLTFIIFPIDSVVIGKNYLNKKSKRNINFIDFQLIYYYSELINEWMKKK